MVNLICLHNEIQLVTKINTFFIVFHFDDDEHGFKIKKSKIASKFWYIYRSVTFFFFSISFFFFSPRPFCISGRVCTDREGRSRPPVPPSVRPICSALCLDLLCRVLASCSRFLLPVWRWGGARVVSASSTQGRRGQSFGYVHIHGRSMASNKRQHYFRRSSTHTWDRGGQRVSCRAENHQQSSRANSPEYTYRSVWRAGSHFVPCCIPANLEDSPRPSVTVD